MPSVAVVGSGITGLSACLTLLEETASSADGDDRLVVTLFEGDRRPGGHAHTVRLERATKSDGWSVVEPDDPLDTSHFGCGDGLRTAVDVGFMVANYSTYTGLLGQTPQHLTPTMDPSNMSFSFAPQEGSPLPAWSSGALGSSIAGAPIAMSRLLRDALAFESDCVSVPAGDETVRSWLQARGYSDDFCLGYFVPMCSAVWSCGREAVLDAPAATMLRFMLNHSLHLATAARPEWVTPRGRSVAYVAKWLAHFEASGRFTLVTDTWVSGLEIVDDSRVRLTAGSAAGSDTKDLGTFDAVILAQHAPAAASLVREVEPDLADWLDSFPYTTSDVYLHADPALMPTSPSLWASWNFIDTPRADSEVFVTYYLNQLQPLARDAGYAASEGISPPGFGDFFVSLNPPTAPDERKTYRHLRLDHPELTVMSASAAAAPLAGCRAPIYAGGAYLRYGFHEDGHRAGSRLAAALLHHLASPDSPPLATLGTFSLEHLYKTQRSFSPATWVQRAARAIVLRYMSASFAVGVLEVRDAELGVLRFGEDRWCRALDPVAAALAAGSTGAVMVVRDAGAYVRIAHRFDLGLAEAYMEGELELPDTVGLFHLVIANRDSAESGWRLPSLATSTIGQATAWLRHWWNANTEDQARLNISAHYDMSNDFFASWLDASMTYSCAVFDGEVVPEAEARASRRYVSCPLPDRAGLEQAQRQKCVLLADKAGVRKGSRVLEIGNGWGSLSSECAARGATVVGLTLSREQKAHCDGLGENFETLLEDYRVHARRGLRYDAVVSCEMIEAVGHEYLPVYFGAINTLLAPGGRAAIQAIIIPDERYDLYRTTTDFINTYIFPGGLCPSVGAIRDALTGTSLVIDDIVDYGPHYAETLRAWARFFEEAVVQGAVRARLQASGSTYDHDMFVRMFRYYFAYCEAGFGTRTIRLLQIVLKKEEEDA